MCGHMWNLFLTMVGYIQVRSQRTDFGVIKLSNLSKTSTCFIALSCIWAICTHSSVQEVAICRPVKIIRKKSRKSDLFFPFHFFLSWSLPLLFSTNIVKCASFIAQIVFETTSQARVSPMSTLELNKTSGVAARPYRIWRHDAARKKSRIRREIKTLGDGQKEERVRDSDEDWNRISEGRFRALDNAISRGRECN